MLVFTPLSLQTTILIDAGERNFHSRLGSDIDICSGDVSVKSESSRLTKGEIT